MSFRRHFLRLRKDSFVFLEVNVLQKDPDVGRFRKLSLLYQVVGRMGSPAF